MNNSGASFPPSQNDFVMFLNSSLGFADCAKLMEDFLQKEVCSSFLNANLSTPQIAYWETRKIASHVNLGTAIEIALKSIILCKVNSDKNLTDYRTHNLIELYDCIAENSECLRKKLDDLFGDSQKKSPKLVAIEVKMKSVLESSPTSGPVLTITSLKKWLEIISNFLNLPGGDSSKISYQKMRYIGLETTRCKTYIDNPTAFFLFLEFAQKLAFELAKEEGIIQ